MDDPEHDEPFEDAQDSAQRRRAAREDTQDGQWARADPLQGCHRLQAPQVHLRRAAGRRGRRQGDAARVPDGVRDAGAAGG
eukprot:6512318-Prymnesium_polylepis.1